MVPPDTLITHALVGGLIVSRFGLWLFDLCVSQLLQDEIISKELGKRFILHVVLTFLLKCISTSESAQFLAYCDRMPQE